MIDLRSTLLRLAGVIVAAAPCLVLAQQQGSRTHAATPALRMLEAGNIRGELLTVGENNTLSAGSGAFAQIRLSTDNTARKGIEAELLVEASNGEVVSIGGYGLKTEGQGRAMRVRVEGLRKGRDRNLLVEVKLPQADADRTTLKITLRAPAAGAKSGAPATPQEATTAVAWNIKDCAGSYYGALQQIRENADLQAREKWQEALKPDPSLPKGWLFAPGKERQARRRRRSDPAVTAASPVRNEREILAEAAKLMRAGRDSALERNGDLGWVLGKAGSDLDSYLSQPANPAICTGAVGLADYYEKRLSGLAKRGEKLNQLATDARLLAQNKVGAVFDAARTLAEDTPGWRGVTPVSAKTLTIHGDSLTELTLSLAELAGLPADTLGKVREATAPYEALIAVQEAGIEADGMPEGIGRQLRAAFTALDAAARLEAIRDRHMTVQNAYTGRITAIRDAHGKHCVCGG
jgi:hypothetical protein